MSLEESIIKIIVDGVAELDRPDLFRTPIVAIADADNPQFAQLKELVGPWHQTPQEMLPEAKRVISYFTPFTRDTDADPRKHDNGSFRWSEAYQVINEHYGEINARLQAFLEEQGYPTATVRSTHNFDPETMECIWSHRSAGVIAGLGEMAANRMIITDKGSGGRFCTVVTAAPLEIIAPEVTHRCLYLKNGSCGACFKACPVGALKPDSFDKYACQDVTWRNQDRLRADTYLESCDTCGKCISSCPFAYIE